AGVTAGAVSIDPLVTDQTIARTGGGTEAG
ncbi:MAG: hypothetical protein RLZZ124_1678, partial [Cyanobacteriota bacterium]